MTSKNTSQTARSTYLFGFNGKLKDDEVYGSGNFYNYGFRMYDPRLGRFLSVDPLTKKYPMLTPYQFASNTPIQAVDLDGAEAMLIKDIILYKNSGKVHITLMTDQSIANNADISLQTRLPNGTIVKGSLGIVGLNKKFPDFRLQDIGGYNKGAGRNIVFGNPPKILSSHPARPNPQAKGGYQMNDFVYSVTISQKDLVLKQSTNINTSRADNGTFNVAIPGNAKNASANLNFDQLNAEPNNFNVSVLNATGKVVNTYNPTSGSNLNISNLPAGGSIKINSTFNANSSTDNYSITGKLNYQTPVKPTKVVNK